MQTNFPTPPVIGTLLMLVLNVGRLEAQTAAAPLPRVQLSQIEQAYADFNDSDGAISLIDSDPQRYTASGYDGQSRAAWQRLYTQQRSAVLSGLAALAAAPAPSAEDLRAANLMHTAVAESSATASSLAPAGHCEDAQRQDLALQGLQEALYACFAQLGNSLRFENGTVTRVAAFEMLTRLREPRRREALFRAFLPLWAALNGRNEENSPYRRMIRLAAAEARRTGSPIDSAARTIGVTAAQTESWLERILETWRQVSGSAPMEPWDYRFAGGAAERELAASVPRADLQSICQRYYVDLGLDLAHANVLYDLEPRSGKAPLAYTDYVRRGRWREGVWQPTLVRVSANYERGGLGPLNELVHENGHAAHMLALRVRPAFMDLGDPLFYEAFADVPAWSVYEPAWQQKYLGRSAAVSASLRALYSGVMLDVAWALFDLRMLRDPGADPNGTWTQITQRYLHIKPHPELAWWAVRVQLVDKPGYMVNYGLGAVITADIRQRIAQQLGGFDTGDTRWFGWLAAHLLSSGEDRETSLLLRQFLGRTVSEQALLRDLQRVATKPAGSPPAGAG